MQAARWHELLPWQMTPAPGDSRSGRGVSGHSRRKRGLGTSEVVGCALAALGLALLTALLAAPPDQTGGSTDRVAQTHCSLPAWIKLHTQVQTDAKTHMQTYDKMLDPAGPIAEAMGSVGAVADRTAPDRIRQVLDLKAVQP
jgi:hypothetical protein